ncbi:MAG: DUF1275 domain-containing protein [Cyanobacteria bacterium RI_101]|nr:DUF1275 domain-containing protein [Cyanobacteria bacterium RI_101]
MMSSPPPILTLFSQALLLSAVAGFVDAASYWGLAGLFTSHITGNLVVAAAEILGVGGPIIWVRLAIIPVFVGAVAVTTVLSRRWRLSLQTMLGLEAAFLLLFTLVAVGASPRSGSTLFWAGSLGVLAMAWHNALLREFWGHLAPTTAMTNNLTQFAADLAALWLCRTGAREERRQIRQRLRKFGGVLLGFTLGAVLGGILTHRFGLKALFLPTLAVAALALGFRRF